MFQDAQCGGLGGGLNPSSPYDAWHSAAGTPVRLRTAADVLEDVTDWTADLPAQWTPLELDALSAEWYPGLLTFGASGGSGTGFPQFRGYRINVDDPDGPEGPEQGYTEYFIGLGDVGVEPQDHPVAWIDFAEPMRAVWVELRTIAGGATCGVRFQHRRELAGGGVEYVTLASLKPGSLAGGVVLDLASLASFIASTSCTGTVSDFAIDRVVFDPAEPGAVVLSELVNISWQSMATAQAAALFGRPYRMVEVGALGPTPPPEGPVGEIGASVLRAMWPITDHRFRLNGARLIAGAYYRAPSGSDPGGVRAAVWHWDGAAWVRLDLDDAAGVAGLAGTQSFASALSEPYIDERGQYVAMVGGARVEPCVSGSDPQSCGKPHAAAWCLRLLGYSGSGPASPTAVTAVLMDPPEPCPHVLVNESVIHDLRVVPTGVAGQSYAAGCGAVGMWCAFPVTSSQARRANTHAAVFLLRTAEPSGYSGQTKVIHYGKPFECVDAEGAGPISVSTPEQPVPEMWSKTAATAWVRGTTAGDPYAFSAVGQWQGDLTCHPTDEQAGCDRFGSAMQWDWNAWNWQPSAADWMNFPRLRAAPPGTRRHIGVDVVGDDGGGPPNDDPDNQTQVMQVFAAMDAVRSDVALDVGGPLRVVTSVGWMVDSCFNQTQCGCDFRAAVFEYPDGLDTGYWHIDPQSNKPWILADAATGGGMRALNLHASIWSGGSLQGPPDNPASTPHSKASAVCAPSGAPGGNVRFVVGAAFDAYPNEGESIVLLDSQRGVIWRGSSASLTPSPYSSESQWCGRKINLLVGSVIRLSQVPPLVTWQALEDPKISGYENFAPAVLSGQDITDRGRLLCISRISPTEAYHVSIMVSPFDATGDDQIDGADLGLLLGAWGTSNPPLDFDASGTVDGADLGLLLGAWGSTHIEFSCGASALASQDLEVVLRAVQNTGFQGFQELKEAMVAMPPPQAGFLAQYIKIAVDIEAAQGGNP